MGREATVRHFAGYIYPLSQAARHLIISSVRRDLDMKVR